MNSYFSTPTFTLFKAMHGERCTSLLVQEYESVRFDMCVIAGKLFRTPVIGTFTGAFPQANLFRPLRAIALKLCRGLVICATRELSRVVSRYKLPSSKVVVLHYPLDFSVWYPGDKEAARSLLGIPQDAQVLMYHGETLLWTKGLDVLLSAWATITQDNPNRDLRLILIGTGADAEHLSRLLGDTRLRGVRWVNEWIHDRCLLQRYLSAADIYLFPSRTDAFGIAITEAMACGLPVVASDVRGIPDIFPKGEGSGGMLVPPGDINALITAIDRILNDPMFARELGRRARHHAETAFSMETIGKQLGGFLLDACR
jgi:glycosyltransferase involved in cell wall biosynthesis